MATEQMRKIQQALKDKGCDPGAIDGIPGPRTVAAIRKFQESAGLTVDGIAGPQTTTALLGQPAESTSTASAPSRPGAFVWFEEALSLQGTKETLGKRNNPEILEWAETCNIDYNSDDIPWCGLFVAQCIASTLPGEKLPPGPLGARNWLKFGKESKPVQGAVLVFWRGNKDGPNGHVGFYHGEDNESYHVLGGNQSDSVNVCRIKKGRLLGARWPSTASGLSGSTVLAEGKGGFSHNEA